jgi:uncharacterized protein with von Willebrand factor type A (vWA) domain
MIQMDDMQILKKIKTETNSKINKLTQDFSECAKLIEEIKISSNLEIPEQVNYLRKRLETASETDDTKKSSHRSRIGECTSSKTVSSSSTGSTKSSSKSPQTPSMYRYYNPFSIQIKTNKELTRSLSPDDRIKMMKGKQDLSPRLVFIKNSMKEIGEKGM